MAEMPEYGWIVDDERSFLAVAACVVVAVEPNGFAGARPEVLRRASGNGAAVSVYWNVNAHTRFSYAVAGAVVTSFELSASERVIGARLRSAPGTPLSPEVAEIVRGLRHRSSTAHAA